MMVSQHKRLKMIWPLLLAAAFSSVALGQNYTIQTFAGGGALRSGDNIGDGGPPTGALLVNPTSVAIGPLGELYIADSGENRVRKVLNGVITTVAGNGNPGYSGDHGPATSAELNQPYGVAVDALGNLFISDNINGVIRKVDTTGIITTIAGGNKAACSGFAGDGGAATSACLVGPMGIALDTVGNLYIADGDLVREVTNGTITSVAGAGVATLGYNGDNRPAIGAQLNKPQGVAVDAAGNIYIADTMNFRVRMVSGGVISTVAGKGSDDDDAVVGSIPAISAGIMPNGVALDLAGNIYIADSGNTIDNFVFKVTSGQISTIAGRGFPPGYGGDNGPAINAALNGPLGVLADLSGKIYVADSGNGLIRELIPPCTFVLTTAEIDATGAGGSFNIGIQTGAACGWSLSGLPAWIMASTISGTGPATVTLTLPVDYVATRSVSLTLAGLPVTVNQAICAFEIDPGGESFPAAGGSGTITVTATAGCSWQATNTLPFVLLTGNTIGTGSGTVNLTVTADAGIDRAGTFMVAGLPFTVQQQSASLTGLNFIGSMPHIAAEENWTTEFTLVNKSVFLAEARLSFYGDPSGPLPLPLAFPQQPLPSGSLLAASLDEMVAPNASLVIDSAGPQTPPVQIGSAQLSATQTMDGFAIFHLIPGAQEAVVPMEIRNASSYLLAFDNTNGVVLGVALANVSAQAANVPVVIRDDSGAQTATGAIALEANGHTSFVLSSQFPATANGRGTIEFDTPVSGRISVLGIRTTPLGASTTLTTIPALANIGTGGGSIAHIAVSNGWQTTFVLVNAGAASGVAHLKFFDNGGNPLPLSVSYPQTGAAATTVSSADPTLAAGAMLMVQADGALTDPLQTGSAQLTTTGNISGFVIFRYQPNGQEAVVPLESRNASAYLLAFDNTGGTATGIAVNTVSAGAANIPVIVRDGSGAQIGAHVINLAANGHFSDTLGQFSNTLQTVLFPETAGLRGTLEFDTPAGGQIGALGIRVAVAHTFTTLPALAK
jgi:NHL repeat